MAKAVIAVLCATIAAVALFYGHTVVALICLGLAFVMLLAASVRTPHRRGGDRRRGVSAWFPGGGTHHHDHHRADGDGDGGWGGDSSGGDGSGSGGSD